MSFQFPYISRRKATKFVQGVEEAIKIPSEKPLLHYAYGMGGIGKTTLIEKIMQAYSEQFQCAEVSFDINSSISTPIDLMRKLNEQLINNKLWNKNNFQKLYDKWQQAIQEIKTEVNQEKSSENKEARAKLVKRIGSLVNATTTLAGTIATEGTGIPVALSGGLLAEKTVNGVVEGADSLLEIGDLLKQLNSTKNKPELQKLVSNPLPELVEAFVTTIVQKSQTKPVVLFIDNYEKASSEFDAFLCQYLLASKRLCNAPVRIVMAGRYSLKNSRYQRMFQQYTDDLIAETQLGKFTEKETINYLKEINITDEIKIRKFWKATRGYPYYLNLIREQKENGKSIKLFRGGKDITDLLLSSFNETEKKIITVAAYCRWFDELVIEFLLKSNNIEEKSQNVNSWFEWLNNLDFVVEDEHYSLDDVARNVIRQTEYNSNDKRFAQIHQQLADYFQQRADEEVDEETIEEKYEYIKWQEFVAESTYHQLFANKKRGQTKLLTHFFEGAYIKNPTIAMNVYTAINAEYDLEDNDYKLLPGNTKNFLMSISLAIGFGWIFVDKDYDSYKINFKSDETEEERNNIIKIFKNQVESSLDKCFKQVNNLHGLSKCFALLCIYKRIHNEKEQLRILEKAKEEIISIGLAKHRKMSINIFFYIGNTLVNLERYKEALQSYDELIELDFNNYEAWINRGSILYELRKYEEAIKSYNKAIEINPYDFKAWNNKGTALDNLERYEEALQAYEKASKYSFNNSMIWANKGNTLNNLERYEEALQAYEKLIKFNCYNYKAWLSKGDVLSNLKKYKEAIDSYNKAIKINPNNSETWINKGSALDNLKQYEEALQAYEKAIELEHNNDIAFMGKGSILYKIKKYNEALNSYNIAIKINCNNDSAWNDKGIVLYQLYRYEEALNSCDKAIEINSNNDSAWNMKALNLSIIGDFEESIKNINKATELKPDEITYVANKGIILARKGDYQKALEYCEKAISMNSEYEAGYYAKACYFALKKDEVQAIENLSKAISIAPYRCCEEAKVNPDFKRLKNNPQFIALIESNN